VGTGEGLAEAWAAHDAELSGGRVFAARSQAASLKYGGG